MRDSSPTPELPHVASCHTVWRYAPLYRKPPASNYHLTLAEGNTPCLEMPLLADRLGLTALFFKREDLNPTGSHKDRSLAFQVSTYWEQGCSRLLISSSGNAGVSASAYAALAGISMYVFVSPQTPRHKLERIHRYGGHIIASSRAISFAKHISRQLEIPNLRPSTNPRSIEGFQSIGWELFEQLGTVDSIFTYVSSASSLIGIGRAFQRLKDEFHLLESVPQLHAVQSGLGTSIAAHFVPQKQDLPMQRSVVGDLGAKKTALADEAIRLITATGGSGWIVSDADILAARHVLGRQYGIETSSEGCAAFAALQHASQTRQLGRVVVLLTGHGSQWEMTSPELDQLPVLNTFSEIATYIERHPA
ncbi:MAG: PLP-dependent lyase/thiolase [Gemmatimonadetes bacterium]|nr:MAG: PLP-dependent lyase/thiolase [Gemmatimonadota bacterium]